MAESWSGLPDCFVAGPDGGKGEDPGRRQAISDRIYLYIRSEIREKREAMYALPPRGSGAVGGCKASEADGTRNDVMIKRVISSILCPLEKWAAHCVMKGEVATLVPPYLHGNDTKRLPKSLRRGLLGDEQKRGVLCREENRKNNAYGC